MFLSLVGCTFFASAQSSNVQFVMSQYAKFGAGEIPAIVAALSPDIVWKHAGDPAVLPFAGTFKGQAEVGRFFEAVGSSCQITVFSPTHFREEGNKVINDTHIEGVALSTGKKYTDDVVMTWTFDATGKPVAWEASGSMSGAMAAFKK